MGLYILMDWDLLERFQIDPVLFLRYAKGLKGKLLQYRDKKSPLSVKRERLKFIRRYWKKTLIVNDEVELLPLADGIHIGQEDLEYLSQRWQLSRLGAIFRLAKTGKIIGLSTHNREEILEANRYPVTYIGLGAFRSTTTKGNATLLKTPIDPLVRLSNHPVAIIGGVRLYDKIPGKFKVVGSDLCRFISIQLKKNRNFKGRWKSL